MRSTLWSASPNGRGRTAAQASISLAYDEWGAVTRIYIMRNPDGLSRLDEARTLE
ncbi:hypothetical protein [Microvirga yunnanensis]|uniref:hypothetical protein n=1 Tax=Microvirga yunnanensis TaxID=2953740 RepID=UPI0021C7898E|nr:hypothetical protein [Microvirga sp. HBU65207]